MSSLSSTAGSASAASRGPGDAAEAGEWLRTTFGVVLFVAWALLTFVWVASTVYLVEHGTFFSMMVIYLINFSVLSVLLIVACRDVTVVYFGKELLQGAMEFSDRLLHLAHLKL